MYVLSSGALLAVSHRAAVRPGGHPHDSVVATLFAALTVEAWLNEVLFIVRRARREELVGPLVQMQALIHAAKLEDRGTSLPTRLDVAATALTGMPLDWGRQPYQDLDLLLAIRNYLVHQRPETLDLEEVEEAPDSYRSVQRKLIGIAGRLVERGIVSRPSANTIMPTLSLVQAAEVGRWAFQTATLVIKDVGAMMPAGGWLQRFMSPLEALLNTLGPVSDVTDGTSPRQ